MKKEFNQIKYIQDYNKEHYKQVKIDLPIELFEKFNKKLKEEKKTKRQFIIDCINNYLNS
ncbi:MAG: hypothetical protein IKE89_03470 [Bacilli bacterium]|nr:hypothetical protein [Bacilli bacterium]MBR2711511.1 hypothetical protein [Bacilli bacterium]